MADNNDIDNVIDIENKTLNDNIDDNIDDNVDDNDNDNESYHCPKCNKPFKFNCDYMRHLNRKVPCADDEKIKHYEQKKICKFCGKSYTRTDSVTRHQEKCSKKLELENKLQKEAEKELMITKLMKEMRNMKEERYKKDKEMRDMKEQQNKKDKEVQKELAKMKEQLMKSLAESSKHINIGSNNSNIQNNIHNEIKIIAYGKEDTSYITDNEYKLLIHKGFKSVPNLVEYIHFNGNKPENQNIYISNMRDNYVLVYDGGQWQMRERDDILQDIIDNKTDILNEKFDELLDKLDEITIKRFKKFLDEKDEDKVSLQLKKDLKLIMYNRNKITSVKPKFIGSIIPFDKTKFDKELPISDISKKLDITEPVQDLNPELNKQDKEEIIIKTYRTKQKQKQTKKNNIELDI